MLLNLLIVLLTSNALTSKKDFSIYCSRLVIISLASIIIISQSSLYFTSLEKGIGLFGGLYNITSLTHVFNIFICIITIMILSLTAFYPRKIYNEKFHSFYNIAYSKVIYYKNTISNKLGTQFRIIEYALIVVFVITGGIFLMSSTDLITIFLSIELQSYGLYIISSIYRDSELATGSGLMYFLLGGLSSCFILLGSALLYTITGVTILDNIYLMINISDTFTSSMNVLHDYVLWDKIYYIQLAIIVMIVGFLFKISAAPFHFWSPDVYDGIPTIVTTFVAIVAKISIFIFLLYFVYYTESNTFEFKWVNILLVSSLLSLIIGSVLGLTQFRIKRLFAYSTISHIGFILLALSIGSPESIQSYVFYILQYSLSNLNAFIILLAIGYSLYLYVYKKDDKRKLLDKDNSPIQLIDQIKGYFYINSFIAISLAITIFSFIGIPPIVGFFAKQMVLSAALDKGHIFMSIVAILTSVIGAAYYLNLIKNIFFFKHDYQINPSIEKKLDNDKYSTNKIIAYIAPYNSTEINNKWEKISVNTKDIKISSSLSVIISIITLSILLFIFIPNESFNLVNIITINLFNV